MIPFLLFMLSTDPVSAIANDAAGRVGAAVEILETHKIVIRLHENERFPMQSVYKLPIGMAVLTAKLPFDRVVHVDPSEYISAGQHSPLRDENPKGADVSVRELLRLSVSESDGTASDVLMRLAGGSAAVMKHLSDAGVRDIMIRDTEMSMGKDWSIQYKNWATPMGALSVLRALHDERLLKFMFETKTFPTRLKALLPEGTPVAHKTGSSGERNGIAAATNDIGIITLPNGQHLAIAVFVSDSRADAATRDRVIAKIARQAWDLANR